MALHPFRQFIQSKVGSAIDRLGDITESVGSTDQTAVPEPRGSFFDRLKSVGSSALGVLREGESRRLQSSADTLGPELTQAGGRTLALPQLLEQAPFGRLASGDLPGFNEAMSRAAIATASGGEAGPRYIPLDDNAYKLFGDAIAKRTPLGKIFYGDLKKDILSYINPKARLPKNYAAFNEIYTGVRKHLGVDPEEPLSPQLHGELFKTFNKLYDEFTGYTGK